MMLPTISPTIGLRASYKLDAAFHETARQIFPDQNLCRDAINQDAIKKLEASQDCSWLDFVESSWLDFDCGELLGDPDGPDLLDLTVTLQKTSTPPEEQVKGTSVDNQPQIKRPCPKAETGSVEPSGPIRASTKRGRNTDGWSKYGQKRVKHDGVPAAMLKTSYRCNSRDCTAKKVVHKLRGDITEMYVFHGQHNHLIGRDLMDLMCSDEASIVLHDTLESGALRRTFL